MKASILLATYNKNDCLPNTLYSIARQKVSFPFEVCIVDDISIVDPEPIVRKFFYMEGESLPSDESWHEGYEPFDKYWGAGYAKYQRLDKHVGGQFSQSLCCNMMDEDSDIVIIQSCDVMYLQDNTIQHLCDAVRPGYFTMAIVKNIAVKPNLYEDYDEEIEPILANWDQISITANPTQGINIYSGKDRPGGDWLFFLGAMTKEDLLKIDFDYRCCDVVVQQKIKERGMQPIFLDDIKAVHQKHPPADLWPCSIVDRCEYWCKRKGGLLR